MQDSTLAVVTAACLRIVVVVVLGVADVPFPPRVAVALPTATGLWTPLGIPRTPRPTPTRATATRRWTPLGVPTSDCCLPTPTSTPTPELACPTGPPQLRCESDETIVCDEYRCGIQCRCTATGDCDENHVVNIAELVTAVHMILNPELPATTCLAAVCNCLPGSLCSAPATIECVITAVTNALRSGSPSIH